VATHVIGSGGDFATVTLAEASLTLPETGGTIYEITGTVAEDHTFTNANYSNGLLITVKSGEEADGILGGATYGKITSGISFDISKLNFKAINTTAGSGNGSVTDCDIGNGTSTDVIEFSGGETRDYTNCIIRDGSDDGVFGGSANSNLTLVRCTIVDASRFGALRCVATDTLILGSGNLDFHTTMEAASDFLASSDSTASAQASTTSFDSRTTADLNNFAGGDYNLDSGSSLNTAGSGGGRIGALLAAGPAPSGNPWNYYAQQ